VTALRYDPERAALIEMTAVHPEDREAASKAFWIQ
jgi:hypothetical protein